MLAQRHRWWPSIAAALGRCIVLSGVSGAGMLNRHQHNAALGKHGTITQCCFNEGASVEDWVNIETALVECHVISQSIQQTGVID